LVVERGASLYAGLIALYVLMLHRMGGGDDFSIGIALANRHHEGLQDLIGYFANEVAIRAQFDEAFTFQNILANTYTNILEGMAHADTPFHKVTEALRIPRSSNRTSVFQAMFALQEREWHSLDDLCPTEGDLKFQLKHFNHNTSKFEVHLQLRHDGSGGLEGDLHIATDLFTEESGKRMVSMYKTLMKNCMENPDIGIRHHDLVSGVERGLVASTNATSKEYTIHSLFQFLTVADPSSDAIYCDGTDNPITSHGDLQQLIRHAAGYLQKNVGLMPNMKVGLVINSSVYAIASIFGIILSGSAIVVLDAEKTPVSRCKMIFEDAGVSAVLIENKFLTFFEEDLKVDTWEVIALNELFLSKYHMPIEYQDFKKDDLFGIFYTSGSTGTPKGKRSNYQIYNILCNVQKLTKFE
jgi:Non-ribosomal peptide synthetase modules and related proteins